MRNFLEEQKKIKEILSRDRFMHSKSVATVAEQLALHYGASCQKAITASMLHDIAKGLSDKEYYYFLSKVSGVTLGSEAEFKREKYNYLHALVSVEVAQESFRVEDPEILSAIRYHTYGRNKVTLLEKIVYIADVVEPLRESTEELKKIRRILEHDSMDEAILYEIKCKMKSILKREKQIPLDLIGMYNTIIREMEEKNYENFSSR